MKLRMLYLVSIIFYNLNAQYPGNLQFKHYSLENGLSNNEINCIIRDTTGFIWIGTEDGLNKFDGYKFEVFKFRTEDTTSLSGNHVHEMLVDKYGDLWIATNGGISKYRPQKGIFKNYIPEPLSNINMANHVFDLIETDTSIIFNTVFSIYNFSYKYDRVSLLKENISENSWLRVMETGPDSILWIGTDRNVLHLSLLTRKVHKIDLGKDINSGGRLNYVSTLCFSNNILYVGTTGAGLKKYNIISHDIQSIKSEFLDENYIHDIYRQNDSIFWIAHSNGVNIINEDGSIIKKLTHVKNNKYSLSGDGVHDIFIDKENNYWFGIVRKGLDLGLRYKAFDIYNTDIHEGIQLTKNYISCIMIDKDNNLWAGSFNGGIDVVNFNKNKTVHFDHDPYDATSLGSGTVFKIFQDTNGRIWVGTFTGGLQCYDPEKGYFITYKNIEGKESSIGGNDIRDIVEDNNGHLWLAVHGNGVDKFNPESGRFTHFNIDTTEPGFTLANNYTSKLLLDENNNLWIGTYYGISVLGPTRNNYHNYISGESDNCGLSNNVIIDIFEDSEGVIWIGTQDGLNRFNEQDSTFKVYTVSEGLPDNVINCIQEDDNNNLWISTNKGLSRFSKRQDNFINFEYSDGLQSDDFYERAGTGDEKGKLYFGGMNGISHFYPEKIEINTKVPKVIITDFNILNANIENKGKYIENNQLVLPHNLNTLQITYVALNYDNPDENEYAIKLAGFDAEENGWTHVKDDRSVTYTNLDPGDYTFRVKASNNDGVWNERGASLHIKVVPPYWQTFWFRTLALVLVIGLFYLFFILRTRELKTQKLLLEKQVKERTREIEEKNRLLMDQTNELNDINALLEERQQDIQSQSEELRAQADVLYEQNEKIAIDHNQLRTLIDNIPDFIYIKDTHSLFIRANKNLVTNVGAQTEDELIGKSDHDFYPKDLADLFYEDEQRIIKTGKAMINKEEIGLDENKNKIIVSTTKVPIYDSENNIVGLVGIGRDITKQKMVEEKLRQQSDELQATNEQLKKQKELIEKQSRKLKLQTDALNKNNQELNELNATKDKFFSIIAHDLKNPFNSIMGFSELLKLKYDKLEEDKKRQFIEVIYNAAQNTYKLLENLLQWSRAQLGTIKYEPGKLDLYVLTKDIITLLKPAAQKKEIELVNVMAPDTEVFADKNMINAIIRNLITNAIKFTLKGHVKIDAEKEGDKIIVSVSDTGQGMTQEEVDQIFKLDNTFTKKGTSGESGSGLGLILCKEFVEKHNGNIWVESELNKGTTIYFTLHRAGKK